MPAIGGQRPICTLWQSLAIRKILPPADKGRCRAQSGHRLQIYAVGKINHLYLC